MSCRWRPGRCPRAATRRRVRARWRGVKRRGGGLLGPVSGWPGRLQPRWRRRPRRRADRRSASSRCCAAATTRPVPPPVARPAGHQRARRGGLPDAEHAEPAACRQRARGLEARARRRVGRLRRSRGLRPQGADPGREQSAPDHADRLPAEPRNAGSAERNGNCARAVRPGRPARRSSGRPGRRRAGIHLRRRRDQRHGVWRAVVKGGKAYSFFLTSPRSGSRRASRSSTRWSASFEVTSRRLTGDPCYQNGHDGQLDGPGGTELRDVRRPGSPTTPTRRAGTSCARCSTGCPAPPPTWPTGSPAR